jgi:signal transduction histidine kinase
MSVTTPEYQARAPRRAVVLSRAAKARLHDVLEVAVLAGLYYGAARFGYAFEFSGPVAAIVWLPVGVGIAYLYLRGLKYWPGVLVGDVLANHYTTLPLVTAVGTTTGNVLEVFLGALLLRRLSRRVDLLGSVEGVAWLLLPIAVATTISATVGLLSSWLGDVLPGEAIPTVWRTWWLGDACGALLVVPLAVAWSKPVRRVLTRARAVEGALMLAATVALAEIASRTDRPLIYVIFPGLIWAALRFGRRGATLAVLIAAGIVVWNTTHLYGPFVFDNIDRSVLSTQLFITVASLSTLCLAAVVSERELLAKRLGESRAQLVRAADAERHRIERNLHDGAQQRLIALAMRLRLAEERTYEAPEDAAVLFEDAHTQLQIALDELRELSHGIHPAVLTDLGLANAIRSVAARTTIPTELLELPTAPLDSSTEATAYYVLMEAVANAQKHSDASLIQVRAFERAQMLRVEIVDDGNGGASEELGSGLRGLRERVEALGGTFAVDSRTGRGTRIGATIPLGAAAI